MPPIIASPEFQYLHAQLRHLSDNRKELAKNDYDVFLVSRFDGDDRTLRPYLSTGYKTNPLLPPQTLYPAELQQPGKSGQAEWVRAKSQGGGHAEETFIRSLNELGTMFGVPRLIEVYVSRIPCSNRSGPWQAHEPFETTNMFWPAGCGPKLWEAVKATPHIKWRFYWEDAYPDAETQNLCEGQMARIRLLDNAKVERCAP